KEYEVAEHTGEPLREIVSRFAEEPDDQLTDDPEAETQQYRLHRSPSAADEIGGNDEKYLQEGPLTAGEQRDQQDTCEDEQSPPPAMSVHRFLPPALSVLRPPCPVRVCCLDATIRPHPSTLSKVRSRRSSHTIFGQCRCPTHARFADSSAFLGWVS